VPSLRMPNESAKATTPHVDKQKFILDHESRRNR
jgi:hypothetical protein